MQSIPLEDLATSFTGHSHGKRDMETPEMWQELRQFLATGIYPSRLVSDKDKLLFAKRARRYLLCRGRLWLAPKKTKDHLPRLVIEDLNKRGTLMAEAHNECGHRGRDAVY
jgi:hypothetical protein